MIYLFKPKNLSPKDKNRYSKHKYKKELNYSVALMYHRKYLKSIYNTEYYIEKYNNRIYFCNCTYSTFKYDNFSMDLSGVGNRWHSFIDWIMSVITHETLHIVLDRLNINDFNDGIDYLDE